VVYRHYATLYFVFIVDEAESELAILDLIQVRSYSASRDVYLPCEL
jgi:AP-3 complex subunit sigma